jgi:hypothetical protein
MMDDADNDFNLFQSSAARLDDLDSPTSKMDTRDVDKYSTILTTKLSNFSFSPIEDAGHRRDARHGQKEQQQQQRQRRRRTTNIKTTKTTTNTNTSSPYNHNNNNYNNNDSNIHPSSPTSNSSPLRSILKQTSRIPDQQHPARRHHHQQQQQKQQQQQPFSYSFPFFSSAETYSSVPSNAIGNSATNSACTNGGGNRSGSGWKAWDPSTWSWMDHHSHHSDETGFNPISSCDGGTGTVIGAHSIGGARIYRPASDIASETSSNDNDIELSITPRPRRKCEQHVDAILSAAASTLSGSTDDDDNHDDSDDDDDGSDNDNDTDTEVNTFCSTDNRDDDEVDDDSLNINHRRHLDHRPQQHQQRRQPIESKGRERTAFGLLSPDQQSEASTTNADKAIPLHLTDSESPRHKNNFSTLFGRPRRHRFNIQHRSASRTNHRLSYSANERQHNQPESSVIASSFPFFSFNKSRMLHVGTIINEHQQQQHQYQHQQDEIEEPSIEEDNICATIDLSNHNRAMESLDIDNDIINKVNNSKEDALKAADNERKRPVLAITKEEDVSCTRDGRRERRGRQKEQQQKQTTQCLGGVSRILLNNETYSTNNKVTRPTQTNTNNSKPCTEKMQIDDDDDREQIPYKGCEVKDDYNRSKHQQSLERIHQVLLADDEETIPTPPTRSLPDVNVNVTVNEMEIDHSSRPRSRSQSLSHIRPKKHKSTSRSRSNSRSNSRGRTMTKRSLSKRQESRSRSRSNSRRRRERVVERKQKRVRSRSSSRDREDTDVAAAAAEAEQVASSKSKRSSITTKRRSHQPSPKSSVFSAANDGTTAGTKHHRSKSNPNTGTEQDGIHHKDYNDEDDEQTVGIHDRKRRGVGAGDCSEGRKFHSSNLVVRSWSVVSNNSRQLGEKIMSASKRSRPHRLTGTQNEPPKAKRSKKAKSTNNNVAEPESNNTITHLLGSTDLKLQHHRTNRDVVVVTSTPTDDVTPKKTVTSGEVNRVTSFRSIFDPINKRANAVTMGSGGKTAVPAVSAQGDPTLTPNEDFSSTKSKHCEMEADPPSSCGDEGVELIPVVNRDGSAGGILILNADKCISQQQHLHLVDSVQEEQCIMEGRHETETLRGSTDRSFTHTSSHDVNAIVNSIFPSLTLTDRPQLTHEVSTISEQSSSNPKFRLTLPRPNNNRPHQRKATKPHQRSFLLRRRRNTNVQATPGSDIATSNGKKDGKIERDGRQMGAITESSIVAKTIPDTLQEVIDAIAKFKLEAERLGLSEKDIIKVISSPYPNQALCDTTHPELGNTNTLKQNQDRRPYQEMTHDTGAPVNDERTSESSISTLTFRI